MLQLRLSKSGPLSSTKCWLAKHCNIGNGASRGNRFTDCLDNFLNVNPVRAYRIPPIVRMSLLNVVASVWAALKVKGSSQDVCNQITMNRTEH